ncbi:MAG: sensor histidine kinase [Flavisolibacter sp.]|jgi:PAS domain S-box-containing protein|nr:sensor histidine kinase [Flavisolibacter sp.]
MEAISTKSRFSFLQGGGELGSLTRNYNWSQTSIGDPEQWPQSLRTTVSIILNSKFPMFLWWGDELLQFYNDAYRPSLGYNGKHPSALGQKGEECWPEIWPVIKPLIDQVLAGGEATWSEDQLIPIYRNGCLEDVYWTFSYTPVNDEEGDVGGVLVVCTETTDKVKTVATLRLSDSRFQNLVREASVGIILLSGEAMIVDLVNESYGGIIDRTPAELMGKPLFTIIPETEEVFRPILESVRTTGEPIYLYGQPYHINLYGVKKEGFLDIVCQPYKEGNGTISGVLVLCHDVTQTVTARRNIEESEHRFRSLIEQSTIATCLFTGREMIIEVANETILRYWGKNHLIIGKPLQEAVPELEGQDFLQILDDVFTTGKPYVAKNSKASLVIDGKLTDAYFDFIYKPMFNKAGDVYGIMDTAVDVTEKVLAQNKIEESEQNLRNTILQAPVAMCIFRGPEHVVEIANDRMFELWGKRLEDVISKPIFEGLPEAKGQGFQTLLDNVYTKGETYKAYGVAVMLPRESSIETVYLDFVYEAFRDADNTISGVMAVATDVTEQVLARKKIETSEARFRLMADAMPQFAWTGDANGNLNYYNQAVYDYSGLSYEQIQKDGWLQIIHPDDREDNIKMWMHSMETGEDFIFQHRFKNAAGDYRWQLSRAVPQRDSEGVIQLWIGTSTDIHEQKLFEEELAKQVEQRTGQLSAMNEELTMVNQEFAAANQQLIRSNEELEQFTYAASHDMQEPLRKVHTFTTFLLDNNSAQLDERGKTYLAKIGTSVHRMKNIIDDLLNYSHQTREEQELEPVNLNKIIEDIEADLELVIQQKKAVIIKDEMIQIKAVPTQMTQLFFNLFSNALKFSKQDVPVQINIQSELLSAEEAALLTMPSLQRSYAKISFCDNGIGFGQQHATQIFNLFKRLHGKSEYEGTGIGLGLCKKIVQNHQGVIWAESEEDKGARFYIVLPV